MRKTKLNFLTKLLFVSISLLLYGCLNEEVVDKIEHEHKHRFDTEYVPLSKVNHIKPHVDNFVQKHTSKFTSTDHLNLNEDRILVLSDTQTNYVSYSIGINNTIPANQNYFFDNLHVIEQDQIVIDNFIYRWIPDNPSETFNIKTFSGKVQKYDLDYQLQAENTFLNGQIQTNKVQITCVFIAICTCSGDPEWCGCTQPSCPTIFGNYCNTGGGGEGDGGDGFGDGLSGEGGGGGGSNNTSEDSDGLIGDNGDPLHPIIPLPEMEENLTPCGKLKNLLKKPQPDIKSTIINNLRPNINVNPNGEKAAYLQKLPNGTMGTTVSYPTTFGQIGIKTGSNFYSAIHTHPKNRQPMFSWSDIYVLYKMNLNLEQHNAGLASFLLVCEDDNGDFQTYAISFDSIGNSIENVLNDPQYAGMSHLDIVKIMDKKLYDKYVKEENSGFTPNYEKAFLKFLDGNNISLYKANESLTEWSKLNLNEEPNTSTVVPTPCN